jgi:hypothetical protein
LSVLLRKVLFAVFFMSLYDACNIGITCSLLSVT